MGDMQMKIHNHSSRPVLTRDRARGVEQYVYVYSSYYFAGLMKRCADTVDTGV
jgi:hypothetical protein